MQESRQQIKDYPDVMGIEEMCALIGVSLTTGYKLLKTQKIPGKKVGRAYRVLKKNVLIYLNYVK